MFFGQGDYANAEPLFQRALDIDQRALDPRHPRLAFRLTALAEVLRLRGEYDRAEPLYERALSIREQALGASHPEVAEPGSRGRCFGMREVILPAPPSSCLADPTCASRHWLLF